MPSDLWDYDESPVAAPVAQPATPAATETSAPAEPQAAPPTPTEKRTPAPLPMLSDREDPWSIPEEKPMAEAPKKDAPTTEPAPVDTNEQPTDSATTPPADAPQEGQAPAEPEAPEVPTDWAAKAKELKLNPQYFGEIKTEKEFFEALGKRDLVFDRLYSSEPYLEYEQYVNTQPVARLIRTLRQDIAEEVIAQNKRHDPNSAYIQEQIDEKFEAVIERYVDRENHQLTDAGKSLDKGIESELHTKAVQANEQFEEDYQQTLQTRSKAEKTVLGHLSSFKEGEVGLTEKEQNQLVSRLFADATTWNKNFLGVLTSEEGKQYVENMIWSDKKLRTKLLQEVEARGYSRGLKQQR